MSPRPYRLSRRQEAVDATRARILRAARTLLLSPGSPSAFSIDHVARGAHVTRATVYHQFGSRRGLFEAVFDDLAAHGGVYELRHVFQERDPDRALERFVATFGHFWSASRLAHRRLEARGAWDPGLERALAARQERRRVALRLLVGRIHERHGRPPLGALEETIDVLFTLTSFHTFDALAGPSKSPAEVAPVVLRLARGVLGLEGDGARGVGGVGGESAVR
jgi:AcrR family transcriptional regulator